jgi:hypothetical protein
MVNKKIWLGILVMMLVFGMAVVGCDNVSTSGGGDESPKLKIINEFNEPIIKIRIESSNSRPIEFTNLNITSSQILSLKNESYNIVNNLVYLYTDSSDSYTGSEGGVSFQRNKTTTVTLKSDKSVTVVNP